MSRVPAKILANADQDLAKVEGFLQGLTDTWREILEDPELSGDLPSSTEQVAILHSLIDSLPLPKISMAAVLAVAVHRLVTGNDSNNLDHLEEQFKEDGPQ